jgi:carboxymethylenebutenolidase
MKPQSFLIALATLMALTAAPVSAQESHSHAYSWLPPGAEGAVERLNESPRHGEWAMVRLANGDSVRSWVVYPERADAAPVVVVIHEIYGLTNWVRAVADQMAAEGFIAIAPDLLTMEGVPTDEAGDPERQAAVAAIRGLDADRVHAQIRAVAAYAMGLDAARPVYGITGFCWGGSTSFQHAVRYADIMGAVPFYGSSPDEADLVRVSVPVLGHYGGDDARVNASIPRAVDALGGSYWPNLYDGAGHGFLRQQSGRDGANHHASVQAWPMTVGFFRAAAYWASGAGPAGGAGAGGG